MSLLSPMPSDGPALSNGIFVSASWGNTQGPLPVPQPGPARRVALAHEAPVLAA